MQLLRSLYRNFWVLPRTHRYYRNLSLAETFTRIYASGAWAEKSTETFCSGNGSQGAVAEDYCRNVIRFIRDREIKSVADLGCGDFQIGRRITSETHVSYVGVDIVPNLIERNIAEFSSDSISFQCANLVNGPLPRAELCLVRQVLQHLSNAEIEAVLVQVSQYPLALISEHVPKSPRSYNRDKPHGPDVRAYYGSGVYVEMSPFSRQASVLWKSDLDRSSVLQTVLIERH